MHKFKGWIPTVSGCLSFSIFGENNYPTAAVSKNIANRDKRYIVSWQKRFLSDTALPFKEIASKIILKQEGTFWCVCVASCSNNPIVTNDKLTGILYFFHGKEMWKLVKNSIIKQQDSLSSFGLHENNSVEFDASFIQFQNDLIGNCSYYVKFNLLRNGVAELITPENLDSLSKNAPSFPQDTFEKKRVTHLVCSQLFFFLKDIAHHHQHHDPSTDTMIDIYCTDDEDDYSWRCATLRILLRKILEFKRSSDVSILSSSLGLLAYTNSFRHISKKSLENGEELSPNYHQESLEQSIKAAQEIKSLALRDDIRTQELFRSLFFSSLGVILSIIGLVKLTDSKGISISPDESLILIATFILKHPLISVFFAGALILVGMIVFRAIDFTKWKSVRSFYRILQAYRRSISVVFLSTLSTISIYIIIELIISIITQIGAG